jgi:hypothetical protein
MEELKSICKNPWCKATFIYTENDMVIVKDDKRSSKIDEVLNEVNKVVPKVCHKCKSFDSELSGGVTWEDREYEGDRVDDKPHQIRYKVTNFKI